MIDVALQNLGVILSGLIVIAVFYGLSKIQQLYHDHHDFISTMSSGSRDPKAKFHETQQQRSLGRWQATAIAAAIVVIILLCLSR